MSNKTKKPAKARPQERPKLYHTVPAMLMKVVLAVYTFCLFVVMPVIYNDGYNDIGSTKWNFYAYLTFGDIRAPFVIVFPGVMFFLIGLWIWYMITVAVRGQFKEVFDIRKKMNLTDWFVVAFFIASILSAVAAADKTMVLWGYPGWYMGLMAQLSFCGIYFFVAHFFWGERERAWLFGIAMLGSWIVMFLGVLGRFMVDPLGLYEGAEPWMFNYFVSTLGNRAWYTTYLVVLLPVGVHLCLYAKNRWIHLLSVIYAATGFMAIVTSDAAAGFLGLAIMLFLYLIVALEDQGRLLRYLEMLIIFFASSFLLGILRSVFAERVTIISEKIFLIIMTPVSLIPLAISIALRLLFAKKTSTVETMGKARKIILWATGIAVVLGFLYILLNSLGVLPRALSSDNRYLKVDENWGSLRWRIWTFTMTCYAEWWSNPARLLFGMGPDNMYTLFTNHLEELADLSEAAMGNRESMLTNAHNEWLTMFVDEGFLGGISYLGIFASMCVASLKRAAKQPMFTMVAAAILAYFMHNLVSYQQIIAVPYIFLVIAIGRGAMEDGHAV